MSIVPPPYGRLSKTVTWKPFDRQARGRPQMPAGPAPTTATRSSRGRDVGHDVGDARGLVPLHEEPLHRPDRQRPVDVPAAAGPLAGRRADVRAHRRDRVRLAREDVALLEPALGREVQVAAAVRPDGTRFLALDVALEPGGVDGLDEEFLVGIDGQEEVVPFRVTVVAGGRRAAERTAGRTPVAPNLPSRLDGRCKSARPEFDLRRTAGELTLPRGVAASTDAAPAAGGCGS